MAIESIDFSVDINLINHAQKLLLGNRKITPEQAQKYIHSQKKVLLERLAIGATTSFLGILPSLAAQAAVLLSDGSPTIHHEPVGFLGLNDEIINRVDLPKIRTLVRDAKQHETPLGTTAFRGSRHHPIFPESRTYSPVGRILRRTSLDELPQFNLIATGQMAAIGARGWTLTEIEGQKLALNDPDSGLPNYLQIEYRGQMSYIRFEPAIYTLQSATFGKDITVSERMLFDLAYRYLANFIGDWAIVMASIKNRLKGVGVR